MTRHSWLRLALALVGAGLTAIAVVLAVTGLKNEALDKALFSAAWLLLMLLPLILIPLRSAEPRAQETEDPLPKHARDGAWREDSR